MLQTPDGRPGWAYDFVRQGYTVYMMDYPDQGRSAYIPDLDGKLVPPRSGPLMEEVWSGGRPASTAASSWPQAKKYTQWPSDAPNKGKMGDPVFDYFAKTETPGLVPSSEPWRSTTSDALVQLLDVIGQPVILMLNSGVGGFRLGRGGRSAQAGQGYRRSRTRRPAYRERGERNDRPGRVLGPDQSSRSL